MAFVPVHELLDLLDASGPVVSLYLPTHRGGPETRQDPIRLRNLLAEAEDRLIASGMRGPEAQALLRPAAQLVDQSDFWWRQRDGLALFVAPELLRVYRVPMTFEPLVVVARRVHIKPLLPLLSADGTFYVLALSQNEVRLLEGSRFAVQQVELDDVPESLADALKWDDPETTLQWHNGTGTRTGRRRMAMFHGHGYDDATAHRDHILRYFQQVARGIEEILSDEHAPLVLAGVDYMLAIYREAAPHAYISEEAIIGNQEQTSDRELHRQAWAIVEPLFKEEREAARAQYEMRAGQGSDLASSDICEIVWAAQDGRVETLFVALGVQRWGLLEAHKRDISLLDEWLPQAVDLLDLAAARTLSQGGNVYAVAPDDVPGQADAVAVFRYAQ